MRIRVQGSRVIVWAPAKVNLFLEILARRLDGYHEIETVMSAVSIYDTIVLEATAQDGIRFSVDSRVRGDVPTGSANLVCQALDCLLRYASCQHGANVHLVKRIPTTAGLGGGSSDAAAALVAGNQAWQLGLGTHDLSQIAKSLGSDVPFFLYSPLAVCRGRGECVTALSPRRRLNLVIAKPPVALETRRIYAASHVPAHPRRWSDHAVSQINSGLFNRLQKAAEQVTPWIGKTQQAFARLNVRDHQMSGSGAAYFGICRNTADARRVAARLHQHHDVEEVFCAGCSA